MNQIKLLGMGLILLSALSCKEILPELEDPTIPASDRIVLIEELTGASCTNCPRGTAALENILKKFPGKVLAVGIHGSFLSEPTKKSKFDFRNQKAKDLENWFKPWFGKPSATINRQLIKEDENDPGMLMTFSTDAWQAEVEKELQKSHEMNILMDTKYDKNTRNVSIDVAAIPLNDLKGPHKISIYILESGIKDAQADGPEIREEYTFNHVLMDMLTKHDGDPLGNDLVTGQVYKRSYNYTIPVKEGLFDPKRMTIIAMVNKDDGTDRHVIQAKEVHVTE